MSNKAEKIYVGKGKDQFDNLTRLSICLTDLPQEFMNEYNGKTYISLDVVTRREVDEYGNSHYVTVNTWKPEGKGGSAPAATASAPAQANDDLPF